LLAISVDACGQMIKSEWEIYLILLDALIIAETLQRYNASHERAEILLGDTTIIEVDLYNN
jgi:hypothetical protein